MPQISLPVIPKLTFTSVIDILAVAILILLLKPAGLYGRD